VFVTERVQPVVVDREEAIADVAHALSSAQTIPLDVESNGLHAYRAVLCTMQLAAAFEDGVRAIWVIDTLALGDAALQALAHVLGPAGPPKILHDLAFDARMLRQHGVMLGNVIDTAVAARFLGIQQSGLASVAEAKLGVKLSKALQHHDWGKRPLDPEVLGYLGGDVEHLPAIAAALFDEARAKDIVPEIEAETAYRLSTALEQEPSDPRPPYVRIKGAHALDATGRAILKRVADVREEAAERWDVPPFKVVGNDVLLAIARTRKLEELRGRAAQLAGPLRRALQRGVEERAIPPEDEAFFVDPPPPPKAERDARKGREQRLTAWRKKVAKERAIDEQVVLPGHCVQDIADRAPKDRDALATVPGIGARRVERDGDAILAATAGIG
jgi:ribonuclease D